MITESECNDLFNDANAKATSPDERAYLYAKALHARGVKSDNLTATGVFLRRVRAL